MYPWQGVESARSHCKISLSREIERTPFQAAWTTLFAEVTKDWPFYMSCQAADAGCSPGLLQWQKLHPLGAVFVAPAAIAAPQPGNQRNGRLCR